MRSHSNNFTASISCVSQPTCNIILYHSQPLKQYTAKMHFLSCAVILAIASQTLGQVTTPLISSDGSVCLQGRCESHIIFPCCTFGRLTEFNIAYCNNESLTCCLPLQCLGNKNDKGHHCELPRALGDQESHQSKPIGDKKRHCIYGPHGR
jgi:hypothetical protein